MNSPSPFRTKPGEGTGESGQGAPRRRDALVRYTPWDRTNHWLTALAFILAALSGLALFHPSLFGLSALFGGGPWTRILHPYLGLLMLLSFIFLGSRFWSLNSVQPRDWQWLRQYRDVVSNREDRLPEVGKYNAGQKLVYWAIVVCLAVLLPTGVIIWREYFSPYVSVTVVRGASLLHAFFAFVLITSIIIHIYAAIWVKGSVQAMTRGTVTPGWAWKHHRAWYREMTDAADPRSRPD
jgi:formate dehydrogenase subunit gamma